VAVSEQLASIEKVVFLESVMLFSYCTADELLRIAAIASERRFGPGETLYKANEPASTLYCVVHGEVAVDGTDGQRSFGPCAAVGAQEILSGRLRAGSARAARETLTLAIDAEDFFDLLSNNVEIVKSLFRILLHERGPGGL
jgi:CRP-like cAMP-binding protein